MKTSSRRISLFTVLMAPNLTAALSTAGCRGCPVRFARTLPAVTAMVPGRHNCDRCSFRPSGALRLTEPAARLSLETRCG